jgi:hypothetical protein
VCPRHRHFDERKFEQILKAAQRSLLYAAKEALKKVVPAKGYESIRRLFFGATGRK